MHWLRETLLRGFAGTKGRVSSPIADNHSLILSALSEAYPSDCDARNFYKNINFLSCSRFFDCFNTTVNIYMLSAHHQRDDESQEHTTGGGLLRAVPVNVVQSIRAFRVTELQSEAIRLGQHFLYANCAQALTRQQVLVSIAESFQLPKQFGKNYDAMRDCLTNVFHKAGEQPGFLVVLEQLPNTQKFDKEARENLLDVFRDAADFWAEKKIPFRVFFSFQQ